MNQVFIVWYENSHDYGVPVSSVTLFASEDRAKAYIKEQLASSADRYDTGNYFITMETVN